MFSKKNYWNPRTPLLINHETFKNLQGENPYIIIDGGAAGNLEIPFNYIKDSSKFIRFEPRGSKTVELNDDIYIDGGLWDKDVTGTLHVANRETTSSIYPPNIEFLQDFDDRYGAPPRKTKTKGNIKLRSINSAVKNDEIPLPNFIKLDIHSAEFEAVMGSSESLEENLGFMIETWHSEVHLGQHLHSEIENYLIFNGYDVFDTRMAAAWNYKYKSKINQFDKPRYIGSEMLFLRKNIPANLELKFIGLCDLFNFSNYAMILIDKSRDPKIKELKEPYAKLLKKKYRNWFLYDYGLLKEIKITIKKILGRYNP